MKEQEKRSVAIIGGGSAALMLAASLDEKLYNVSIFDRNKALGRKFLVAGDGGFNLTHSEEIEAMIARYTPVTFLEKSLRSFTNKDFCGYLKDIGIETYTGSSRRVFPVKGIKPIEVLNAFLAQLEKRNVEIHTGHTWKGWGKGDALQFEKNNETGAETVTVSPDITVFALGGASWKVTGSDGAWLDLFAAKGIKVLPFQASNCACEVKWSEELLSACEGSALKNIVISCGDKEKAGEVVITKFGIEGGAIYALSAPVRKQLNEKGAAVVYLDLKPEITVQQIRDKFSSRGNRSVKKLLEDRLSFNNVQIALLKSVLSKEEFTELGTLAERIKRLPIKITGVADLDEAISTVGGVVLREVDENFKMLKLKDTYCIGEMLNWDAPTGGYLLQGCFSMARSVASALSK
ncbi:MAG TPA: TIGR03862 family flavoprotein [Bacteroidia bacterium]|jgi:hypothetical protein